MRRSSFWIAVGWLCSCTAWGQDANQARQWLREGRWPEAIAAYTQLLATSPRHPDWLLLRGLAHSRAKQWPQAVADLQAVTDIAPTYVDAWEALANVWRWTDQDALAAQAYARWAQLRPEDPAPLWGQARSLMALGQWSAAQAALAAAAARGGERAPEHQALASALQARQQANAPSAGGYRWAAAAGLGHTASGIGNAHGRFASLRHYTPYGSVALESLNLRRFGDQDTAWAIDAYPRLWARAYANLRYQQAPSPSLYSARAWRAELYQGLGQGWELAASHDDLGFASRVSIDGVAVAKYWGNFYFRWRHQQVRSDNSSGQGDRWVVRYYYRGDADHYVEAYASSGRSTDFASAVLNASRSNARGLAWYHFVQPQWGWKLSWSQAQDTDSAAGLERSASLSLIRRW